MYSIAVFTSLPPIKSGISFYNEVLAKALSKFYTITFFTDSSYEPKSDLRQYGAMYKVVDADKTVEKLKEFDAVIYHFGNNPYHAYMYDIALRVPGIVVLHDLVLHHLVTFLTFGQNKPDLYLSKVAKCYPEYLEKAKNIVKNNLAPLYFDYPFHDEIVNSSLGVIVHNYYAKSVLDKKFNVDTYFVPLLDISDVSSKEPVRIVEHSDIEISCFGFIAMYKRAHIILSVFQKLTEKYQHIKLNFVGEMNPEMNKLLDFITENGLRDMVKFTGFCSDEEMSEYLANSDICVNLRYPSAGETSATLVMALAHGIPTIVSKYRQFDEYPDDVVLKVPLDLYEKNVLYSYLEKLIIDEDFRRALGENARDYFQKNHSMDIVAARYKEIIDRYI
ncbi:MAG: glycosyltransferase family 4 protein [Candidatus Peregrinibacteria bacterium]|nr:glycosyltransferase family 4 protein [Candidatus Peregrinibacteria bacterium]